MIRGVTSAVADETKIANIETGATKVNDTDSGYNRLYYTMTTLSYKVTLEANGGTGIPDFITVTAGDPVTSSDVGTPTKGVYDFAGWYYDDETFQDPVSFPFTPTGSTIIYANWTNQSSDNIVSFDINSDAMKSYFTNVSTWSNGATLSNNTAFKTSMSDNFTSNSCSACCTGSACDNINNCNNPTPGNKCEQSIGYDTGITTGITVRVSDETTKVKNGAVASYLTVSNGNIYNMIPGVTYYWESNQDSNIYGYVKATGQRRTIYSSVRNVRDLGGMATSFERNNTTITGTINYGRLYRGAKLADASSGGQADVASLTNLGITREIDLRPNSEQQNAARLPKYDKSNTSSLSTNDDIVMHNYKIYPSTNMSYYQELRSTMKLVMQYIVNDNNENIYFHCTIGTDRTGTLAYFLEGLLGVSEEDRVEDYEMTYYFGLLNRTRFHDNLLNSEFNPRFYTMYNTYKTNEEIYDLYMYGLVNGEKDLNNLSKDDLLFFADGLGLTGYTSSNTKEELITAIEAQLVIEDDLIQSFRDAMIDYNN